MGTGKGVKGRDVQHLFAILQPCRASRSTFTSGAGAAAAKASGAGVGMGTGAAATIVVTEGTNHWLTFG